MKEKRPYGYKAERRKQMKALKQRRKEAKVLARAITASAEITQRMHNLKVDLIELEPWYKRYFSAIWYGIGLRLKRIWRDVRRARG